MGTAESAVSPGLTLRTLGGPPGKEEEVKSNQDRIHDSCFLSRKQTGQQENLRRMPGHRSAVSAKLQEGEERRRQMAGQVGRTDGRTGSLARTERTSPLAPPAQAWRWRAASPRPLPTPSSCPRTGAGLRTLLPKTTPHGTPTTLPLGRGEPSRSQWLPRWWTGGRQLRGEGCWGQPRPGPHLDKPSSKASDPALPSLNTA